MEKKIYCIYDNVSNTCGDLLQFENDEEAKRFFKYNCTLCEWFKDLSLLCLGTIFPINNLQVNTSGVTIKPVDKYFSIIQVGADIEDEVKLLKEEQTKLKSLHDSVIQSTASPTFIEDVKKLCRYLSKNDKKRFNK